MFEVVEFSTGSVWITIAIVGFLITIASSLVGFILFAIFGPRSGKAKTTGSSMMISALFLGVISSLVSVYGIAEKDSKENEGYQSIVEGFYAHYENIDHIKINDASSMDISLGEALRNDPEWTVISFSTHDGEYYDRARIVYEEVGYGDNIEPGEVLRLAWIEVANENPDEWVKWDEKND